MYMVDGPADRAAPSDWALQSLRDAGIADSLSGASSVETLSRNNSSNNGSITSCGGDQAEGRADGAVSEGHSNDSEQSQPEKSKRKKLVKRSRASSVSSSEAASSKV